MKHNIKVTIILLTMFLITQFIGLYVVSHYLQEDNKLPYGMDTPEVAQEDVAEGISFLISLIISFAIAVFLVFILMNFKSLWFMRAWFFIVVTLALGISLTAIGSLTNLKYMAFIAITLALILAFFKIIKRNILIHNITELFIYPGIAALFVPILNIWTIIALLILISIYDIWAVWHSGIMQKMAEFQMDKLKVFGGFFVPYADKKTKAKIKALKLRYKNKTIPNKEIKNKKIRVSLAILGGGDIVFPIIAAGVVLKTFNNLLASVFVILGATLALSLLFMFSKKKKYYPAMPFLSGGIFLGMLIAWLISFI